MSRVRGPGARVDRIEEVPVLWFALSVGSALFQVLRNMVMKRLGHSLDETINVWGRFTFILPFAAAPLSSRACRPASRACTGTASSSP